MIKYLVCPGSVTTEKNGQWHTEYYGPTQLMKMYNLDPRECEIYLPELEYMMRDERIKKLIRIEPPRSFDA